LKMVMPNPISSKTAATIILMNHETLARERWMKR